MILNAVCTDGQMYDSLFFHNLSVLILPTIDVLDNGESDEVRWTIVSTQSLMVINHTQDTSSL